MIDKIKSKTSVSKIPMLSSGSTLLNLACSNNTRGAFLPGKYYLLVGDSASGKTFLSMTCFAEAAHNPAFQNYRLIYDNVEDGCLIDLGQMFGQSVAERVEPPEIGKDGLAINSALVEEFYYHVDDAILKARDGQPFIYVLDSMDSLTSAYEGDKFEAGKTAAKEGKAVAGSYGDGKAKKNSEGLRRILNGLRDTNSILIIICQTRDNLGMGFGGKVRAGGHALRFYASVEIWTSITNAIMKTVRGKNRKIGVNVKVKLKKNRITGQCPEVGVAIYPSYGIDDTGSCVDYLLSEKWWTKSGQTINAPEFDMKATRDKLIQEIESKHLQKRLRMLVGKCWHEIQEACGLKRQRRYE